MKTAPKKSKILFFVIPIIAIGIVCCIFFARHIAPTTSQKFRLDAEYYNQEQGSLQSITAKEFAQLLADKKSFVIIAHMVLCPAEAPLTTTAEQFVDDQKLRFYDITETEFDQTALHDTVKYLPTAAIYRDGQLVAWLDAESDADLPAYKTTADFERWLSSYVQLSY